MNIFKKSFVLLAIATTLFSCNKNSYTLTGNIKGVANGKKVTLERQQESLGIMIPIDTAQVENGKFVFEGKVDEPTIFYLSVEGEKGKSIVILEHGDINIDIKKDSIFQNKISGTYNNEQLTEFAAANMKIQKKVNDFKAANGMKMMTARKEKDTATINQLMKEFEVINTEVSEKLTTFRDDYINKHPKALISALMIQDMSGTPGADIKKLEASFNSLDSDLKESKLGKKIEKKFAELKTVNVGRRAPDFSAADPTGKKVSLNESIGRVTIIDFWASWCPSCRQENPEIVALYNEYHAKGLNIISVSLDENADAWKAAIDKDKLTWTHVSNLKKWKDPIAATYGVEALPANFILNQYGVVVAKDLHGAKLKEKIAQMMK